MGLSGAVQKSASGSHVKAFSGKGHTLSSGSGGGGGRGQVGVASGSGGSRAGPSGPGRGPAIAGGSGSGSRLAGVSRLVQREEEPTTHNQVYTCTMSCTLNCV